jgi:hypothetical protein
VRLKGFDWTGFTPLIRVTSSYIFQLIPNTLELFQHVLALHTIPVSIIEDFLDGE